MRGSGGADETCSEILIDECPESGEFDQRRE